MKYLSILILFTGCSPLKQSYGYGIYAAVVVFTNKIYTMNELIIKKMNDSVSSVIGSTEILGFEKAYLIADAIGKLKDLLTPEYMRPIMQMQGNRMGFKVDKPYAEDVVKNCLIEAVLTGVQPFGNQFNIIAGNMYITKEGFGYLLDNWPGLDWEIIPELPRIGSTKESAAVWMNINWNLGTKKETRKIEFGIKIDAYTKIDAVIGKATRKARAWLHNKLIGIELGDGEVGDVSVSGMQETDPELQIWKDLLSECNNIADLDNMERVNREQIDGNPAINAIFVSRRNSILKPDAKTRSEQLTKQTEMLMSKK